MSEESSEDKFQKAAKKLKKAMKGFGTDEKALIKAVTSHKTKDRLKIKQAYQEKYQKDLIEDLKSELSGKFEDVMVALFKDPIEYDAECINNAIKGAGTDEDALIEIIASRPNWVMQKIKKKYKELYQNELIDDVKSDTSGDFQKLLVGLLDSERNNSKDIDKEKCQILAKELNEAKDDKWNIDNNLDAFYKYIMNSSSKELSLVSREYYKLSGETIFDGINKKFQGDTKELIKAVLYSLISPSEYFATRIKKAIEGFGTDNKTLIRILVSRCDLDINNIKQYYKQIYEKDMVEDIKNDISGDYKKILVELIK